MENNLAYQEEVREFLCAADSSPQNSLRFLRNLSVIRSCF
mgnify:CR=1 FL=1